MSHFIMAGTEAITLRFVYLCEHKGTRSSVTCDMAEKVARRTATMRGDGRILNKQVFTYPELHHVRKSTDPLVQQACGMCVFFPLLFPLPWRIFNPPHDGNDCISGISFQTKASANQNCIVRSPRLQKQLNIACDCH